MATFNSPWLKQPWQSGSASVGYSRPGTQTAAKKPTVQSSKPNVTSAARSSSSNTQRLANTPVLRKSAGGTLSANASLFGGNRPTGLLSERPSANRPAQQRTTASPAGASSTPWLKSAVAVPNTPRATVSKVTPNSFFVDNKPLPQTLTAVAVPEPRRATVNSNATPWLSQPKTTYTDPRAPYLQFGSKAEADSYFANQAATSAPKQDSNEGKGLFDFNWGDGSDSLWEQDRGFWNNVGNLGVNALGGALGGVGGFLLGGTAGAGAGAGFGWSGANQGYDFIEDKITGSYEPNAWIDYGTLLATGAGLAGGALYNNFANNNGGITGGSGGGSGRGGYNPDSVNPNNSYTGGSNNSGGGSGGNGGSGNGFLGDAWDFFTENPIGQAATGAGATYLADQLFNQGQGTNAIMDFFTGGGSDSSSGGGNEIAYGTDFTPQYIVDAQKEALDRARTLTNSYADYEGPLTAGAAQNELQAANVAADAVGGTADALNDARDMTTGADARYERQEGPSSYGSGDDFFDQASLSGYMNPYLEFVQQDTLDNISRENEAIQAALGDQMIQVGAFGGSRTGVAEAENNRNMRQQMLQYINQSNAEAFENARDQFNRDEDRRFAYSEADRNQFNTDLGRRLNVGQALGSLANMESALTQQEINNLMSTGGVLRDIEQAGYTNDFNAYQDFWNRMLGLNAAENAVALGLQSDVLKPPAPEEDPDRLGQILGVLTAGAGLWNTLAGG